MPHRRRVGVLGDAPGGRARPRSVDAVSRRGSSPASGASLHPSSANKASAAPVPPLPLTHGLT